MPLQSAPAEALGPPLSLPDDAKTENSFLRRFDPHFGQGVPFQSEERTRISLSAPQASQWNS